MLSDKLAFFPAQISARIGDTIEWANADFVAHTATARNSDWDVTILPGKTSQVVIRKAWSVDYLLPLSPEHDGAHRHPVKLTASGVHPARHRCRA